jgi:hypothetical protein
MRNLQIANPKLEESILNKLNPTERTLVQLYTTDNLSFDKYNNDHKQELAKRLMRLSFFVGIKEPLSLDELKLLVFFLCSQYPKFTSEELEQAFMMACSGKFGSFEHYQSFSPIYIGKVINAYETSRATAYSKYKTLNQRKANEEEEYQSTVTLFSTSPDPEEKMILKQNSINFFFTFQFFCLHALKHSIFFLRALIY